MKSKLNLKRRAALLLLAMFCSLTSAWALEVTIGDGGALLALKNQIKLDITQLSTLTVYDGETATSDRVPA